MNSNLIKVHPFQVWAILTSCVAPALVLIKGLGNLSGEKLLRVVGLSWRSVWIWLLGLLSLLPTPHTTSAFNLGREACLRKRSKTGKIYSLKAERSRKVFGSSIMD